MGHWKIRVGVLQVRMYPAEWPQAETQVVCRRASGNPSIMARSEKVLLFVFVTGGYEHFTALLMCY